ncbi:MAG: membrane protein insertion efficiency factor YidD [Polyangiaceae bacterium]|nr:membrane protein insertion efficiency factor YidD [Polyangiaceae bacterium]
MSQAQTHQKIQKAEPIHDGHDHESDDLQNFRDPPLRSLPVTFWNLARFPLLALIRLYQMTFSRALPPNTCRFYPTCSHYGYQAIFKYGVLKGGWMATWRVLRCNPFNPGGIDPVP